MKLWAVNTNYKKKKKKTKKKNKKKKKKKKEKKSINKRCMNHFLRP